MKLSLIIPCYNVAPYVERAVQSVLDQEFSDWELLLVDDGSTDETLSILQSLSEKDCRIRVIAQANRGVSAARNAGLRQARGEYVQFIDADDYISPYGDVERWNGNDVVVYGFAMHTGRKIRRFFPPRKGSSLLVRYLQGSRLHLGGLLFRRALLENEGICFDEQTYYSEDKEVMIKALLCACKICPIQSIGYHYIRRADSAMGKGSLLTFKQVTSIDAMVRVETFAVRHEAIWRIRSALQTHRAISALRLYRAYLIHSSVDETIAKRIIGEVKHVMKSLSPFSPRRYWFLFFFFYMIYRFSPSLFDKSLRYS